MLSVPLVAPLPSLAASVGTKSGSKRIFAAPDANAFPSIYDLFDPSLQIWRSQQSRRVEVKLDDEMMGRGIEVREVDKRMDAVWLRMEDMVLLPEEIVLVVLEEREEAEEGDVNEVKGGYPAAHREFVERIKENRGKLEEAMAPLVVEALGMSGLRFVKAETWTEIFSERRLSQMLNNAFTLRACCATLEYTRNKNVTAGKEYECLSISSVKSRIEMTEDVEQL